LAKRIFAQYLPLCAQSIKKCALQKAVTSSRRRRRYSQDDFVSNLTLNALHFHSPLFRQFKLVPCIFHASFCPGAKDLHFMLVD
jgi:hypothetical protein